MGGRHSSLLVFDVDLSANSSSFSVELSFLEADSLLLVDGVRPMISVVDSETNGSTCGPSNALVDVAADELLALSVTVGVAWIGSDCLEMSRLSPVLGV